MRADCMNGWESRIVIGGIPLKIKQALVVGLVIIYALVFMLLYHQIDPIVGLLSAVITLLGHGY